MRANLKHGLVTAMGILGMSAALTACGGSGSSSSTVEAGSDVIKLTMSLQDNTSSNYYQGAMKIAECVEQATDGKIVLTVQAGGTLGSEGDCLDMAIQGDLDIASCANSVLANYVPEMTILDQAFLWDSADQANYAVTHELGDLIQEKANGLGLHVIGYLESGFRDVFSTRAIDSMGDFRGLKIRVMQNEGQLTAFTSFGANPIALSSSEQFTALQQKTIDACENAVSNCWINKYYEAGAVHVINTRHCFVYIPMCMSDAAWNKIPEDLKDTFLSAVQEGCEAQWQYLDEANAEATENLKNVGVTFHDIDLEELKNAYAAVNTTEYDAAWEAAIEAAKAAVQ